LPDFTEFFNEVIVLVFLYLTVITTDRNISTTDSYNCQKTLL